MKTTRSARSTRNYLPRRCQTPMKKNNSNDNAAKTTTQSPRVLLMDDEEAIRKSTGRMLTHLGYDVEYAEDGNEALHLYQRAASTSPFKAVLLDLTIRNGMGGKETISNLLKVDPNVRAVISSGYSDDPVLADFRKHGFKGVLTKPYRFEHLNRVMSQVIVDN